MKKVLLLSMSLIVCGLLAGCGGTGAKGGTGETGAKKETATYENAGFVLTFSYPEGFFTRSEEATDYMFGEKDGVAYIGKDFTLQVTLDSRFGKTEYWETFKNDKSEKDRHGFFEEVRFDGTIDAYRFYWEPRLAYTALLEEEDSYFELQFCPNDVKSLTPISLLDSKIAAECVEKNKALLTSEVIAEIVKSVKVAKK